MIRLIPLVDPVGGGYAADDILFGQDPGVADEYHAIVGEQRTDGGQFPFGDGLEETVLQVDQCVTLRSHGHGASSCPDGDGQKTDNTDEFSNRHCASRMTQSRQNFHTI